MFIARVAVCSTRSQVERSYSVARQNTNKFRFSFLPSFLPLFHFLLPIYFRSLILLCSSDLLINSAFHNYREGLDRMEIGVPSIVRDDDSIERRTKFDRCRRHARDSRWVLVLVAAQYSIAHRTSVLQQLHYTYSLCLSGLLPRNPIGTFAKLGEHMNSVLTSEHHHALGGGGLEERCHELRYSGCVLHFWVCPRLGGERVCDMTARNDLHFCARETESANFESG